MPPQTIRRSPRRAALLLLCSTTFVASVASAACSGSSRSSTRRSSTTSPRSTTTTAPGGASTPEASLAESLSALLEAEQRGDHVASYRLLSDKARTTYRDQADWVRRRGQLPPITGFTITGGNATTVTAEVRHRPGLDPFIGLSAAREHQTWHGQQVGGGWLVDGDPEVAYILPPDDAAARAALQWARAVQACDQQLAGSLQAVTELYGRSEGAAKLCSSRGEVTAGRVGPLQPGPSSVDLIAQYSTDAQVWARSVRLTGPAAPLTVVLAPIGDEWKVVGVAD